MRLPASTGGAERRRRPTAHLPVAGFGLPTTAGPLVSQLLSSGERHWRSRQWRGTGAIATYRTGSHRAEVIR